MDLPGAVRQLIAAISAPVQPASVTQATEDVALEHSPSTSPNLLDFALPGEATRRLATV
jgi:hypothetical protein